MRAVTVVPGVAGWVRLEEAPEPDAGSGSMVVEALAVGICGIDAEIVDGTYGWPPPGRHRLVLGHESLGRVVDPEPSGFRVGENVVAIVRRPDPVPCPNCAVGEWDMCSSGGYTERGIKQVDRFTAERWRITPEYAVRVDPQLGVVVFGSVNANRRHYYRAARAPAAEGGWLEQLIIRRVSLDQVPTGLQRAPEDIQVILEFAKP
jgi:threonine dehydrogenase-like Zn-dependent dehydrogenase